MKQIEEEQAGKFVLIIVSAQTQAYRPKNVQNLMLLRTDTNTPSQIASYLFS